MVDLPKGGNAAVVGPVLRAVLQTRLAPGEIDIFNQEQSGCGSLRRTPPVEMQLDLRQVPVGVDAVVLAASLDDGVSGHVAGYGGGDVAVHDGAAMVSHTFTGLTTERCVIMAEVYRRAGGWKVRAVSQGFDDLAGLIAVFGVESHEEPGSVPPSGPAPVLPSTPQPEVRPVETREIIARIRAGAVTRRPAPPRNRGRLPWEGNPQRRGSATLLDAWVPRPSSLRSRLFGREHTLTVAPSAALGPALRQVMRLAGMVAHREAVEAWSWLAINAMDLPPGFGHAEHVSVHTAAGKIVLDVGLPDRSLVPADAKVRYKAATGHFEHVPAAPEARAWFVEILFSAAVLAHAYALAEAVAAVRLAADLVLVVNGWERSRDPATGLSEQVCRATLATSARELRGLDLAQVDSQACLRGRAAGSVSEATAVTHPYPFRSRWPADRSGQDRSVRVRAADPRAQHRRRRPRGDQGHPHHHLWVRPGVLPDCAGQEPRTRRRSSAAAVAQHLPRCHWNMSTSRSPGAVAFCCRARGSVFGPGEA